MNQPIHRRHFLRAGAGFAAAGCVSSPSFASARPGWTLAVAQYTFREFSFFEAIEKIDSLGIKTIEGCFFLRLRPGNKDLKVNESLSAADRAELQKRLAGRGMEMPVYYSSLGADADAARRIFDFGKEMGVKTLVAEPPAEAFDMLEKLCDEYQINLAVHNHPESPKSKYWKPESVLAVCEGRGKRIGACCDTGHWVRSAIKPVECLKKMEGRIISLHLKDVAEWGNPEARDVPLGRGKGDYAAVLAELKRQGFKGVMTIEYEHQSPQLMDEVKECAQFVEKTAAML